jgi:hypothetical protein
MKLYGLIAQHGGRFSSVRDAIVSTQRVTTERLFCGACDRVTDHRAGKCCNKHVEGHCPSCDKVTLRQTRTGRCLEPTHREPVRQYCYHCQAPRVFNARDNCVSCGQRRGSGRSFGW